MSISRGRPKETGYIYSEADTFFEVNSGDVDLDIIRIRLPSPPQYYLIDGYGDAPEDQFFKRLEAPDRLKQIERDARDWVRAKEKKLVNFKGTGEILINKFWELFEERRKPGYDEMAEFVKEVYWIRKHGYWFFNHGKPTYITGDHFDFLNFWTFIDEKSHDEGRPEYRDADRRRYLFRQYAETTRESVTVDKDGRYCVKDMGVRVCYGTAEPKFRRCGVTGQAIHKGMKVAMSGKGRYFTIISMEGDNAEKHWKKKLVPAFEEYPLYLTPIYSGSIQNSVGFDVSGNIGGYGTLKSVMDYTDSGGERKNDGDKIHFLLADEEGKCFGVGTKCLMYDGSVKEVQDVVDGDVLMGDDGTPRNVISTTRGRGEMYKIIPKKGESWRCNDAHILTLSVSDQVTGMFSRKDVGRIVDMDLKDYLRLSERGKTALCLFREAVDYPSQYHELDPYLLGIWLGDGSHSCAQIHNVDNEIIEWLYAHAKSRGWGITKQGALSYNIYGDHDSLIHEIYDDVYQRTFLSAQDAVDYHGHGRGYIKTHEYNNGCGLEFVVQEPPRSATGLLRDNGLFMNKHIPLNYKIDSRENRMRLLAGLCDSDGYAMPGGRVGYEIVQKRRVLAEDIKELALSLGFYASLIPKIATMKKPCGSKYKCEVYRVRIYGSNLHEVPCLVERKRFYEREIHKNTRNHRKFSFHVEPDGFDDYYGFVIDGNRRFLLSDYTVVHNTTVAQIVERWNVNKLAMSTGGGSNVLGFSIHPTTVEDMDVGGEEFMKLCNYSKFYDRGNGGQTSTGLFEMFVPAYDGQEGFVDKYGSSVIGTPTQEQIEGRPTAIFAKFNKGAKQYVQDQLDEILRKQTPESQEMYRSLKRKLPLQYADCWIGSSGDMGFDMEIIDNRIAELRRHTEVRIGRFEWTRGFGSDVMFVDDPTGPFELSMKLSPEEANQRMRVDEVDPVTGEWVEHWAPKNPYRFTASADPFKAGRSNEAKMMGTHSRQSDGGLAVLLEHDEKLDQSQNMRDWESFRFVCSYRYRPPSLREYQEDALKMCIYFGAPIYPERNIGEMDICFTDMGYGGYYLYDIDTRSGMRAEKPGFASYEKQKGNLFAATKDYIRYRGHKERHLSYLEEVKNIKGTEQMGRYDRFTAHGGCLLGSKQNYYNRQRGEAVAHDAGDIQSIIDFFSKM